MGTLILQRDLVLYEVFQFPREYNTSFTYNSSKTPNLCNGGRKYRKKWTKRIPVRMNKINN